MDNDTLLIGFQRLTEAATLTRSWTKRIYGRDADRRPQVSPRGRHADAVGDRVAAKVDTVIRGEDK